MNTVRSLICVALIGLSVSANAAASCGPPPCDAVSARTFSGKAIAVMDGDTLMVIRDGRPVKVRLAGIDAPEKVQPYGGASRKSLAELVKGKEVRVVTRAVDDYGRLVGIVHIGEVNVNHEQVRRGMAWAYSRFRPRQVADTTSGLSAGRTNDTRQAAGYGEAGRLREGAEDGTPAPANCTPPCRAVNGNRELTQLQREAQQGRRGLWAEEGAVEPWQWRKQHPRVPATR